MDEDKKITPKVASKISVTIFDKDKTIIAKEIDKVKEINGTKFNVSAFLRDCLRNESILEEYRKTPSYRNER